MSPTMQMEETNAPVDTTAYEKGSSILLKGQENMKREGYSFTGWNTKADGSGISYAAGSTYPNVRESVVHVCPVEEGDAAHNNV